MVDPTGHFAITIGLLMAIGFGVGAIIGACASVIWQFLANGCSWGQLALDTVLGGFSGLLSMSTLGLGAMIAVNAGLGFVGTPLSGIPEYFDRVYRLNKQGLSPADSFRYAF